MLVLIFFYSLLIGPVQAEDTPVLDSQENSFVLGMAPAAPQITSNPSHPGKPRLILHIGGYKTGTTALQRYLGINRHRLKDQGIFYPVERPSNPLSFGGGGNAGSFILKNFRHPSAETLEKYFSDLKQKCTLENCHTAISSSEHWTHFKPEFIQLIEKYASTYFNACVIFGVRELGQWAFSYWSEDILRRSYTHLCQDIEKKCTS